MKQATSKSKNKSDQTKNRQVVLFDNDEFYGFTLDMVLWNFTKINSVKITSKSDYVKFVKDLSSKKYRNGIYILDEFFGRYNKLDQKKILTEIRKYDKDADIIMYTTSKKEDIKNIDEYDHFALKTSRNNQDTIIKVISDILGIEFQADNSSFDED
jgi:hypothetical protein